MHGLTLTSPLIAPPIEEEFNLTPGPIDAAIEGDFAEAPLIEELAADRDSLMKLENRCLTAL